MISLRHMSLLTQAGWLAVLAAGVLAFLGLLALRFQRRGAARFWASPAAVALCLLPAAVAAASSALVLRETMGGMALTGAGGAAAIAAGAFEALTPLLAGLVAVLVLSACSFLLTAGGSSRSSAPPSSGLAGWVLLSAAFGAMVLAGGLVALLLSLASALGSGPAAAPALTSRLTVSLGGAAALVVLTIALALVGAFVAPRGPSDLAMKLASLATFAFCGLTAMGGLWAAWTRSQALMQTALTGVADEELPEPVQPLDVEDASPARVPPPPPPPPPGAPASSPGARERVPGRAAPRTPPDVPAAVRVGGTIREPRKIRNVSPVYPDIAKQARVQGVVILEATIGPRGDVSSVRVLRGIPLLDQSAIDAVRQWVYEPTLLNGVPVPVIMTVTVNYKLGPG